MSCVWTTVGTAGAWIAYFACVTLSSSSCRSASARFSSRLASSRRATVMLRSSAAVRAGMLRARASARGLVAGGAAVVQLLCGARPALDEVPLARERPLGQVGGRLGLPHVGLACRELALPGRLDERDALALRGDVRLEHADLLLLGADLARDVRVVEPGEHRTGRDRLALGEGHRDDAARDLAAHDPFLAFDEPRVVQRRAPRAAAEHDARDHEGHGDQDDDDPTRHALTSPRAPPRRAAGP